MYIKLNEELILCSNHVLVLEFNLISVNHLQLELYHNFKASYILSEQFTVTGVQVPKTYFFGK